MMDIFGESDPRKLGYRFWGARHVDYSTAVRAEVSKQNYTVCPLYWYIDATFQCSRCSETFVFAADEQKFWYEELKFWIDSIPSKCAKCRKELRDLNDLQQEYDRDIAATLSKSASVDRKERLIAIVDAIEAGGVTLAAKAIENRRILTSQIEKSRRTGAE